MTVRLLWAVIFAGICQGLSAQSRKIVLNVEVQPLPAVLEQVQRLSGYNIIYSNEVVSDTMLVSLHTNKKPVSEILQVLLGPRNLFYARHNNDMIVIGSNTLREKGINLAFAQSKIAGRVTDETDQPVPFATVGLLKNKKLLVNMACDERGKFEFMFPLSADSSYTFSISSVGFHSRNLLFIYPEISGLKNIVLVKDKSVLAGVTVKTQLPLFTRSVDRLTFNVEGSIYEKGEDGLHLFSIIPGVMITGKDIQFRGSETVTVYVDDRKIPFSGDQLFTYLRSIPSESIKSYELKTIPGAEVDAQNGGVIINIILKSEYKYGLSGNINTGYWYNGYNNKSISTSANYRVGKVTLQWGFNYRRGPAFYEDSISQEFKSTGIYSSQTENYFEDYHTISYTAGIDYKITSKQTLGANYNRFANPGNLGGTSWTTDIKFLARPDAPYADSSLSTNNYGRFKYHNQMANIFYRHKLDSLGSKVDVGYSYIDFGLDYPSALETKYFNRAGMESHPRDSLFTHNSGSSVINVANADIEKYFSKTLVLGAGSKYTATKTDYSMNYRVGFSERSPLDTIQSNRFLYNEQILAFYGTIRQTFKNWQAKMGVRTEQTTYSGKSVTDGQIIGRTQWDWFPSAYLSRKIGTLHSFTLSYTRTIGRPGFRQLNPFTLFTSLSSIQEGNPYLLPYYSNNIQLEYLLKNKYSLTFGYQNTNKAIATNFTNKGEVVISKEENISDMNNIFASFYIPLKLSQWWELSSSITLRNNTLNVQTTPPVHRSRFSQYISGSSRFNLPRKYFIEVSGFYSGGNFYGIYNAPNLGKLDITIKKSFLNDHLTARVELQDPFHLYRWGGYTINTNELARHVERNKLSWSRYIGIWLTYNFSKGKKQTNRENIDAGGNEARGRL